MKSTTLAIAFLTTAGAVHADEVPFFASPNVPDYIAIMAGHEAHSKPPNTARVVKQHDGWTFVEEKRGEDTKFVYANFFKNLTASGGQGYGREITWFGVRVVEPANDYLGIKSVVDSKDEETLASEKCRWRELVRGSPQDRKFGPTWMTCLTNDGIEIASKVLFKDRSPMSDMRLTKLKRVSVAQTDVLPPKQVFDAAFWFKPLASYPDHVVDAVDFEATLISDQSEVRLLRHYPWYSRERRDHDGSTQLTVWNTLENQGLSYSSSKTERRLNVHRERLISKRPWKQFDKATGKVDLGRQETFLGEKCTWFDLMPNVADAGQTQCLTSDGIPLKDVHTSGWGSGESFETTNFSRRPVDMNEIMPPQDYMDPVKWGFPIGNE